MSNPHDTDPRYADLRRRLESPSRGGSRWPWLATLVVILASFRRKMHIFG
jgi:hypothetical protein